MEILKIAEPCPLIDPSQVVVTQGEVLVAEPVLTLQGQRQIDVPSFVSPLVVLLFPRLFVPVLRLDL